MEFQFLFGNPKRIKGKGHKILKKRSKKARKNPVYVASRIGKSGLQEKRHFIAPTLKRTMAINKRLAELRTSAKHEVGDKRVLAKHKLAKAVRIYGKAKKQAKAGHKFLKKYAKAGWATHVHADGVDANASLSEIRKLKKEKPVMAKKKHSKKRRSAKQIAATRKLVALNKKKHGKKHAKKAKKHAKKHVRHVKHVKHVKHAKKHARKHVRKHSRKSSKKRGNNILHVLASMKKGGNGKKASMGSKKYSIKRTNPKRHRKHKKSNPIGGAMIKIEKFTGQSVSEMGALALGGALYGLVNSSMAKYLAPVQKILVSVPVVGTALPTLVIGALLNFFGEKQKIKALSIIGKGLVGSSVVAMGVNASQMIPGLKVTSTAATTTVKGPDFGEVSYYPNMGEAQLGAEADFGSVDYYNNMNGIPSGMDGVPTLGEGQLG